MNTARPLICFLLLVPVSCFCISTLYTRHLESHALTIPTISQLPSEMAKTISFEFKGLVADFSMLHVLTFMGDKIIQEKETSPQEWQIIYKALQTIIDLDPRATDPFILATTTLPWETGMIRETNEMLMKVAKYRPNDYRPNFFLWYNYYHFLKDPRKAAEHLAKAAAIPGAPPYLKPLVSRMQLYSGQIESSIAYTMEAIKNANDMHMRDYLMRRLDVLKTIFFLEKKVTEYNTIFKIQPRSLQDLVAKGLIEKIPEDPYGGKFYITPKGKVYTTSNLAASPRK